MCGPPQVIQRRILMCYDHCKRRTRHVQQFGGACYGYIFTCCACGDSYSSDGYLGRPFQRGWRQKATAKAREQWKRAIPADLFHEYVQADIGMYDCRTKEAEEAAAARRDEIARKIAEWGQR